MRRTVAAVAVIAIAAGLSLAAPADAMPRGEGRVPVGTAHKGLTCYISLLGVRRSGQIVYYELTNSTVTRVEAQKIYPDVSGITAWGLFGFTSSSTKLVFQMDAVVAGNPPSTEQINVRVLDRNRIKARHGLYYGANLHARLFTDGLGYYGYAVDPRGALTRYTLTRFKHGHVDWAFPVKLGNGFGSLASLQAGPTLGTKTHPVDYLFATTKTGGLEQISVPTVHPDKLKVRALAASGLPNVTEMSWSDCNQKLNYASLIAVDPHDGQATWVTVRHVGKRAKASIHGLVTDPVAGWDLIAAL